jgi:hypothetical protein
MFKRGDDATAPAPEPVAATGEPASDKPIIDPQVERRTIKRAQIDTVADALRLVPGFGVTASGGRGAVTSLFPRGGESDYTMVLVDGIQQNVFGGGFDAAHLVALADGRERKAGYRFAAICSGVSVTGPVGSDIPRNWSAPWTIASRFQ